MISFYPPIPNSKFMVGAYRSTNEKLMAVVKQQENRQKRQIIWIRGQWLSDAPSILYIYPERNKC